MNFLLSLFLFYYLKKHTWIYRHLQLRTSLQIETTFWWPHFLLLAGDRHLPKKTLDAWNTPISKSSFLRMYAIN